ncbi:protein ecdysoneless [Diachasmimorpha longicaudata]|uniref:protein ecdysoneless n=1 Tax=Diachasmimorpha longicaudata TaxID=58733 RepID=UPI0030B8F411
METIKSQEDILECYLYPKSCYTTPEIIDEALLNEEIIKFNQIIEPYTKNYMWHYDSLVFHPRTKTSQILESVIQGEPRPTDTSLIPHIVARLRYDEDIGDEWFTVFLIFNLTESLEGLIARLVDSDGEFLLIEAADHLPHWAEPETCQDRVYVANGAVHVMRDDKLMVLERLRSLARGPDKYLLSEAAQMAIRKRIIVYPDEANRRRHKARAFLPEKAASILAQEPGLIAFAIRTIVQSDPMERRVCRAMRYFPPEQRTMVNLRMTRCLYAMATHCRYTGDPRTGWNFPPTNSPKYSAHLLGIKVACGLEILVARANERRKKREGNGGPGDDDKWRGYLRRLEDCGYFRSSLQGSEERARLERVAREFLVERPLGLATEHKDDDAAERILEAWKSVKTEDFEMLAQDEASLSPPDDDSWLNVDAQQLESMLNQHWGVEKKSQEPTSIKEKIKAFLNQTSEIEGVEFPGEETREDDPRHDCEDGGRIEFDADVYDSTLRDILDLVVPGGDGEFDGSSEGSLDGDDDERAEQMEKYMRLLDSQLELQLKKDDTSLSSRFKDSTESNLVESMEEEAGGAGPAGNIIGGPVRRLMHLHLQSPTAVPPDLQS